VVVNILKAVCVNRYLFSSGTSGMCYADLKLRTEKQTTPQKVFLSHTILVNMLIKTCVEVTMRLFKCEIS
jgi:hypothetical protein